MNDSCAATSNNHDRVHSGVGDLERIVSKSPKILAWFKRRPGTPDAQK